MSYKIDTDECVGCANCAIACPVDAIEANAEEHYFIREADCIDCGRCADACPLELSAPPELNRAGAPYKKIKAVAIDAEKCIGCSLCARACPVKAISGVIKQPYTIDALKCVLCGICADKCKKGAVAVEF